MQDGNHTMWAHLVDGLQRSSEDGLLLFRAWCLPSAINENSGTNPHSHWHEQLEHAEHDAEMRHTNALPRLLTPHH